MMCSRLLSTTARRYADEKLNKVSATITQPKSQGASQAMLYATGMTEEVHVAGVALIPDGRDADLGLGHVLLGHTGGVEHRLRAGAPRALGAARLALPLRSQSYVKLLG